MMARHSKELRCSSSCDALRSIDESDGLIIDRAIVTEQPKEARMSKALLTDSDRFRP
jgi:hypothetical protein